MLIQGLQTTYPVIHCRLNPALPIPDALARGEKVFKEFNPQYPFEYCFVDEFYDHKFRAEQREGALGVLFALMTVGYQAVRAAIANPADSLRSE